MSTRCSVTARRGERGGGENILILVDRAIPSYAYAVLKKLSREH